MDKKAPRKIVTIGKKGARVIPTPDAKTSTTARTTTSTTHITPTPSPTSIRPLPALASTRGTAVHEPNACQACAAFGSMRLYKTIDGKEVLLCNGCAKRAREESLGPEDPLDFAIRVGGFETNRSRH